MKTLHELHLFCVAVMIELVAEMLTDTVSSRILMAILLGLMVIVWFKQRYPHFPWRTPWDEDDWL